MSVIRGIIPVIPTPFTDDGRKTDLSGLKKLVDMAVHDGAHALCLFAAGAEFYKLTLEERFELFEAALEANAGRVPLIATVSSHATTQAVREAAWYENKGASALNIMPPSFGGPSQTMIAGHILEVADAITLPLMIQYAPALSGQQINEETFVSICKDNRELYIKLEASPTGPAITALRNTTKDKYGIVVGNGGECMFEALSRGACAVMPGAATIRPYRKIFDTFESGDTEKAFDLFNLFLPHLHFMLRDIESFVVLEKMILKQRGIMSNTVCRHPCAKPDEWTIMMLSKHLDYLKKWEKELCGK